MATRKVKVECSELVWVSYTQEIEISEEEYQDLKNEDLFIEDIDEVWEDIFNDSPIIHESQEREWEWEVA
ncbi:hypothetical protein HOK00_07375 [bacterium]|nr:hypothetical protein [bacterium]